MERFRGGAGEGRGTCFPMMPMQAMEGDIVGRSVRIRISITVTVSRMVALKA